MSHDTRTKVSPAGTAFFMMSAQRKGLAAGKAADVLRSLGAAAWGGWPATFRVSVDRIAPARCDPSRLFWQPLTNGGLFRFYLSFNLWLSLASFPHFVFTIRCHIPDDNVDPKRRGYLWGKEVLEELIEGLQRQGEEARR